MILSAGTAMQVGGVEMLAIENIKDTLKPLYSQYDDIYKIGIAGSYATNRATEENKIVQQGYADSYADTSKSE